MIDWPSSENTFIHILSIMEENITLAWDEKKQTLKDSAIVVVGYMCEGYEWAHLGMRECSAASSSRSAVARSAGWAVATQPL